MERTFSMIKPDAVQAGNIGKILQRFEEHNLQIIAMKEIRISAEHARQFYAEHEGKPFFDDLLTYITSGPIVVQVLEGENAVALNRLLMGDTDPKKAAKGTIRADFAHSIEANAVHGSDSAVAAQREINFFFTDSEIHAL